MTAIEAVTVDANENGKGSGSETGNSENGNENVNESEIENVTVIVIVKEEIFPDMFLRNRHLQDAMSPEHLAIHLHRVL